MSDYKVHPDAKYAKTHEWVRMEDGLAVVGISDAAQDLLSDVVYVDLPAEGSVVEAGSQIAVVESVKAAEDIVAPVSGTIVAVNTDLEDSPELVNEDSYAAWFFKIEPTASLAQDLANLMSPDEYDQMVDAAND